MAFRATQGGTDALSLLVPLQQIMSRSVGDRFIDPKPEAVTSLYVLAGTLVVASVRVPSSSQLVLLNVLSRR